MTMPFYVSPEQLMKDRADFARKGIAPPGAPWWSWAMTGGIAFVAENPSRALPKVSRSTTASPSRPARPTSSENLRVAAVRYADLRGYSLRP